MATLTPLAECFDHWDNKSLPANDTELSTTAWFVGVGIVLTLSKLLRYIPVLALFSQHSRYFHQAPLALRPERNNPLEPTGSPPLIPLRI
jgi:hypothetical protein